MSSNPRVNKMSSVLTLLVSVMIGHGLNYKEGEVVFRAGVFLMEEIDRNPDIDDEYLSAKCEQLIEQEMRKQK